MKKILSAIIFLMSAISINAQQVSNLYQFSSVSKAETVANILKSELKLSNNEFNKVQELLTASAQSQIELSTKDINRDTQEAATIVRRQTTHIESNLQLIIGDVKFKEYQKKKAIIEVKAKSANGKN